MKTAKRLALLIILVAAWKLCPVVVRADNGCTEACGNGLASCDAQANDNRNQCYDQAQWDYDGCFLSADSDASACANNCYANYMTGGMGDVGGYIDCFYSCVSDLQAADQQCNQSYYSATASCDTAQAVADGTCTNLFNACVNKCPPP